MRDMKVFQAIVCSAGVFLAPFVSNAYAIDGVAAYIERPTYSSKQQLSWYVPPRAELTIVRADNSVYSSLMDNGTGRIITAVPIPDENDAILAAFYSDGMGISSRVPVNFSQVNIPTLMPPTIYSITNINNQGGTLGFVGNCYPTSTIELEIDSYTNEKTYLKSLANTSGEWQIQPQLLSPGIYQAKAKAVFQGMESAWSQEMSITVLAPTDQLIHDLGTGTRRSIDKVIDGLPDPVKNVAKTLDNQSEITSKVLLPTLLTVSTAAQSGILAQNILYLIYQALIAVLHIFGFIKKQPMGLVYDAITKRPLGRTIVRLYEAETHRLVETDVTSAVGVFSFMPKPGYYYLRVFKPGYLFPTQLILAKRDGKYAPIYSGGELHITSSNAVVNVAVPMDPEAYQESFSRRFTRVWQRWFEPINSWLLWLGFFLAILSYSRVPTKLNFVILWLYVGGLFYFWQQGRRFKREYGVVVNNQGKIMPDIELNLIDVEYNRLVSRRVSDEKGRYQFIAPPGRYQIKMVTPAFEMATHTRGAYQGSEIRVEGERGQTKHIIPKIVVKKS
jgi:hypothetical protein